jgi:outer membrane protein assembly factor BamB
MATVCRSFRWIKPFFIGLGLMLLADSAQAVITRLTPLREVLRSEQLIFTVKVEKLDRDTPSTTLVVEEQLKGKVPFRKLAVNLTADKVGQRERDTDRLLQRLNTDLQLMVFVSKRGTRYTAFAYTNGTWFQFIAPANDAAPAGWNFTHCEPYLRRTFKGATLELVEIIKDGLSGKREPPEPDPNEPPGLGPEIKAGPRTLRSGSGSLGPVLAVIPTFVIFGPLALLASLGLGAVGLFLRRWRVLLLVVSFSSTLYILHAVFRGYLQESWWGTKSALWLAITTVCLLGATWSWRKRRAAASEEKAKESRSRPADFIALCVLSSATVGMTLCHLLGLLDAQQPKIVVLQNLALLHKINWKFEAKPPGTIVSSPLVASGRVYVGAAHSTGLASFGAIYCLDASTGATLWTFDNNGELKQVFSSPCLADGRLYVGEGFHEDSGCNLYCLDAATGKKLWHFPTKSHTESSPCVTSGRVYFGAGDDGVYCVDARDGKEHWHFQGLHVDTSPLVQDNRLYAGSGYGSAFEAFCLDAGTGKPIWRTPCNLPVVGSPALAGERVFFGLGNGDMTHSANGPAGALVCLDASTGRTCWRYDVRDGVFARPAPRKDAVWFCSRDHHCYCLDSDTGELRRKEDLGSALVAAPALVASTLYIASSAGQIHVVDAGSGEGPWVFDLAKRLGANAQLFSSPAVISNPEGLEHGRQIYIGVGLDNAVSSTAAVYCLQYP